MKKELKLISLLQVFFIISGCYVFNHNEKGYLSFSIKFPVRKFSIKKIPDATESLRVTIYGTGAEKPIILNLTRENTRTTIEVISEEKTVTGQALDKNGTVIAEATEKILIKLFQVNTVNLELKEINQDKQNQQNDRSDLEKAKTNLENYIKDLNKNRIDLEQKRTNLQNFINNDDLFSPKLNNDYERLKSELVKLGINPVAAQLEQFKNDLNKLKSSVEKSSQALSKLLPQSKTALTNAWDEIPAPQFSNELEKLKNELEKVQNIISSIKSDASSTLEQSNNRLAQIAKELLQAKTSLEQINKQVVQSKNTLEQANKDLLDSKTNLEANKARLQNSISNNKVNSQQFNNDLEKLKNDLSGLGSQPDPGKLAQLKNEFNRLKNIVAQSKKDISTLLTDSVLQNAWDEIPAPQYSNELEKLKNEFNQLQNQVTTINSKLATTLEETNKELAKVIQDLQQNKIDLDNANKPVVNNPEIPNTTDPSGNLKNGLDEIPFPSTLSDFDKVKNSLDKIKSNLESLKNTINNLSPDSGTNLQKYKDELDKLKNQLNIAKINLDSSKVQRGELLTSASENLKNVWDEIPAPQSILTLEKLKSELAKTQDKINIVVSEVDKNKAILSVDLPVIKENIKATLEVAKSDLALLKSVVEKVEKDLGIVKIPQELKNVWDEIPNSQFTTELEKYKLELDKDKTKLLTLVDRIERAKPELSSKMEALKNALDKIVDAQDNPNILQIKSGFDSFKSALKVLKTDLGIEAANQANVSSGSGSGSQPGPIPTPTSAAVPVNVRVHNPSPTPSGIGFEETVP